MYYHKFFKMFVRKKVSFWAPITFKIILLIHVSTFALLWYLLCYSSNSRHNFKRKQKFVWKVSCSSTLLFMDCALDVQKSLGMHINEGYSCNFSFLIKVLSLYGISSQDKKFISYNLISAALPCVYTHSGCFELWE